MKTKIWLLLLCALFSVSVRLSTSNELVSLVCSLAEENVLKLTVGDWDCKTGCLRDADNTTTVIMLDDCEPGVYDDENSGGIYVHFFWSSNRRFAKNEWFFAGQFCGPQWAQSDLIAFIENVMDCGFICRDPESSTNDRKDDARFMMLVCSNNA